MEKKNIYETISAVMSEVGAIGKTQKNTQQNFMFRGIDAVMNALNPAMIKHKMFIVPEVLTQTREERTTAKGTGLIYSVCKIKYTFYAEDGSSVSATVIGEGMDSGDKATNKAMSIAFKYACFQVFCIPTEEMKDPDAESHEVKPEFEPFVPERTRHEIIMEIMNTNRISKDRASQAIKDICGTAKKLNDMTPEEFDAVCEALV